MEELEKVLGSFCVTNDQVYAVTMDNGSNLLKLVRLMREKEGVMGPTELDNNDDIESCDEWDEYSIIEEDELNSLEQLQMKMTDDLLNSVHEWCINSK